MKTARTPGGMLTFLAGLLTLACWLAAGISQVAAQAGNNAVFQSSTACTSGGCAPSAAFIDASVLSGTDICAKIFSAIGQLPATGGVVDARGIGPGTSQLCTSGTPWVQGTSGTTTPSIVLLPSGTITISKTWILPNGSKIIGQGSGAPGYSVTVIQPCTTTLGCSGNFIGTMIQLGPNSTNSPLTACPSTTGCVDVGVEDVALQGGANGASVAGGIVNGQSQDMSYVRRVSIYQIGGIGLKIWNTAHNSGPYSDITFDSGTLGSSSTVCAQILSVSTRGIHGLTCKSESSTIPTLAVQVDSSNNSIKDVRIQGFGDGVVVGSTANALSNVLFNITGGTSVNHVVHLDATHTVKDVSIMGVSNGGNSSSDTILDDVTVTTLSDAYVAMYVLGESTSIGGSNLAYSRFTTSTNANAETWAAGSGTPSGACTKGSLFSDTAGTGDLYVCTSSGYWTAF